MMAEAGVAQLDKRLPVVVLPTSAIFDPTEALKPFISAEHRDKLLATVTLDTWIGFTKSSDRRKRAVKPTASLNFGKNSYSVKQFVGPGKIYIGLSERTDDSSAEKVLLKVQKNSSGKWEFYILSKLQDRLPEMPKILKLAYFGEAKSLLVMHYYPHGNLQDLIAQYNNDSKAIPESVVFHVSLQLLAAVAGLHESGVLHNNFHPRNIIMMANDDTEFLVIISRNRSRLF